MELGQLPLAYLRINTGKAHSLQCVRIELNDFRDGNDGPWSTFGMQVGTPSQQFRVLPATGLDMAWVVHPDGCGAFSDQVSCAQSRGGLFFSDRSTTWDEIGLYELSIYEEAMLGYSGNGSYGYETITLGWPGNNLPSVEKQVIAGITTMSFYLGALGLNPWSVNFTELDNSHPSLISTLKNQSKIPSLTWAYTAGAYNYHPPVFGSLTLGGFDASRFVSSSSNLNFSMNGDISRDLLVAVQSITTNLTGSSSSSSLLSSPIYAYIDSLVPHMWLPLDTCEAFETAFNLTWNSTAELYLVNDSLHQMLLEQNPTVMITVGPSTSGESVPIEMPYWSFMLNASDNLRYFPLKRADNDTQYTLGRVFLQNAYVIANYEFFNFSVHQANYPDTSVPQQIITLCPREGCGGSFTGQASLNIGTIVGIVLAAVAVVAIISLGIWWTLFRNRSRNRSPEWKEDHSDIQQDVPLPNTAELGGIDPGRYEAPDSSVKLGELATGTARKIGRETEAYELPVKAYELPVKAYELPAEAYELPASEPAASELQTPDITPATTPHLAPRIPARFDAPSDQGDRIPMVGSWKPMVQVQKNN